jgi:teichuronic acid biosynthesis glycosyltransferase TuaH
VGLRVCPRRNDEDGRGRVARQGSPMTMGDRTDELVVVIAGTSWDGIWYPERHVAMHLSARIPVLWVDPAVSLLSPRHRRPSAVQLLRDNDLRRVERHIWRLTPLTVPGVSRPVFRDIASWQVRRAVRQAVARLGARVRATVVASLTDALEVAPGSRRVFYATDDFVAGASLEGMSSRWLEKMERRQIERADVVIAISPELRCKWSSQRKDIEVVPNGCDAERFAVTDQAPLPEDVVLPSPIAGYVGLMSERIDLRMLERTADTGVSLLLVGPRQPTFDMAKMRALVARPNVQWVGGKSFDDIPSYMRVIDVGLTPYTQSAFNRACVPLKTIEYLAAGRPVVATDLPAHRALKTPYVAIAKTPGEFAKLTSTCVATADDGGDAAARRAFAQRHSWTRRTADISRVIGLDDSDGVDPGTVLAG